MNLYQLIYKSYATERLTPEGFADILVEARVNNEKKHITGSLLYRDGAFLQILEGDKKDLLAVFEKIERDARHTQVELLHFEPATQRLFQRWSMQMFNLSFGDTPAFPELKQIFTAVKNKEKIDGVPGIKKLLNFFKTKI